MTHIDRRRTLSGGAALVAAALSPEARQSAAAAETAAAWGIAFADLDADLPARPLRLVEGTPPRELNGVLVRNGGARFRRPKGNARHWFDGDGLIRRFVVADGRASMEARFIDTPKRRADAAAGAVVSAGFGTPAGADARLTSADDVNAANISVIRRGDALWALWEAGSPTALDAVTLKTRGQVTLRDDLAHVPFLAHPRFEADGSLWSLGQVGARAVVWRLDAQGGLLAATPISLPRASYIHDFTMTARSLVLVLQPWIYEGEGPPTSALAWRPEQGTEVLVLDKDDLSRRRSFLLPPFFHFHMGAGFEDASGAVRFDICQAPDPSIAVRTTVDLLSGVYRPEPLTVMALVTLSPDGRATLEPTGVAAEFPRTDPRSASGPRTFTLHAAVKSPERPLYQGVGMFDWRTGSSETFDLGEHHLIEEMVFTPRPGAVAEMDGFVIGPAINLKARASELLVFDARRLSAGPLCVWRADVVAPAGLHGGFTAA